MTDPSTRRRPGGCPSNLALDELLAGDLQGEPEEAALREHLALCTDCRARMETRAADPVLVPDATGRHSWQNAHQAVASARRRRAAARWAVTAGVAAAAGLLLFALHGGPRDLSVERTKGTLALTLHVKRAANGGAATDTVDRINGEGRLRAGDEVRFSLAPARAGQRVVVLGLDAAPSVTIYIPVPTGARAGAADATSPSAGAVPIDSSGPVLLPGSVVADATPGFERMVAVLCDQAIAPEALRKQAQAALSHAGGRPELVASLGTGCVESSVLLRKD